MKAVLRATARSSVATIFPRRAVSSTSPAASASAVERMVRPASRSARSESSGTNAPSTKTMRRATNEASAPAASLARAFAVASGGAASGFASRTRARRSVYFQSSRRRCGSPSASKRRNASSRKAATVPLPGSVPSARAKLAASAVSAAVLIGRISAFIAILSRLLAVLRVAARFQFKRQLLAAGLHDAAAREDMNDIGNDVVEQPLIMRDHHEAARFRAQTVDAVGHNLERVDIEAGIGLVEHAQPRLEQCHLQNLVALLLTAGETDVHTAAQHLLLDPELARDLAHALEKLRCGKLAFAALLPLGVERSAQKGHRRHAGNFQRILKCEKQPPRGALVRLEREQIFAVEQHLALGDLVVLLAGEHVGERGLA